MSGAARACFGLLAGALALSACAAVPRVPLANAPTVPQTMQYLYGSGEAAAISVQAWNGLVGYAAAQVKNRPADSVVLMPGASLSAPRFVPCAAKPLAAVFDVDETVLLNLGFEYTASAQPDAFDEALWLDWERTGAHAVSPTPGAARGLAALRAMGVTVIFNTNRTAGYAVQSEAAINGAGIGPAVHGETLYLAGDDATGSRKDGRRATIAGKYCVIAMGGDQLGDFSDLFNAGLAPAVRRTVAQAPAIAAKWGAGWFVLPNPTYGTALKGGFDDVFPIDKRWAPTNRALPKQEK